VADVYLILQVQPTAQPEVIAAAYRALARRHHPDTGGDERAMMVLNAAWDVLRDPVRRAAYDTARGLALATDARRATSASASAAEQQARQPVSSPRPPSAQPPRQRVDPAILDFGRYEGHSVAEVARTDPDYLLWLARTPIGRRYEREIASRLETPKAARVRPAKRWPAGRR
jgi:curved DNA-binding protein CbpA